MNRLLAILTCVLLCVGCQQAQAGNVGRVAGVGVGVGQHDHHHGVFNRTRVIVVQQPVYQQYGYSAPLAYQAAEPCPCDAAPLEYQAPLYQRYGVYGASAGCGASYGYGSGQLLLREHVYQQQRHNLNFNRGLRGFANRGY